MRALKYLIAISISMLLFSCSDKDDTADTLLAGNWYLESLDLTIDETTTLTDGTIIISNTVGVGYDLDYTNTFTENPNEFLKQGTISIDLTTTTGNNVEQTSIGSSGSHTFNWSLDGDKLEVIDFSGNIEIYTIHSLNDEALSYTININREVQNETSTTTTVSRNTYAFSRLSY